MILNLNYLFILTTIMFSIGLFGVFLNRKNIIMILVSIEILFLAISINFSILSIYLDDIAGHVFVIFILTIAAAESGIGLSLIIALYKLKGSIEVEPIKEKFSNKI